jgi:lysophospholipase L1-like esterase
MSRLRICILGDDLATPLGDAGGIGWMGQLSRSETSFGGRFELMSLGVPGQTSRDLAAHAKDELAARLPESVPSLVLFCFGVADMSATEQGGVRLPLPESMFWAETVLRDSLDRYPTLWVGPPPLRAKAAWRDAEGHVWYLNHARLAALNDAYRMLAQQLHVPYLDLSHSLSHDKRWLRAIEKGNGVHPNWEGHAALANHIGRWSAWREQLNATAPGTRVEGLRPQGPKAVLIA